MKIMSKTPGIFVRSINPRFVYHFQSEALEILEEHAEKILKNSNFYKVDKDTKNPKKVAENDSKRENQWVLEIKAIKGIGNKTALDIFEKYPSKKLLISDIKENKHLSFRDDVEKLLKETFR